MKQILAGGQAAFGEVMQGDNGIMKIPETFSLRNHWALRQWRMAWVSTVFCVLFGGPRIVSGQEAEWIWAPPAADSSDSRDVVYFRKSFQMGVPEEGRIEITADEEFELYVNGELLGQGNNWRKLKAFELKPLLRTGRNVIAIKAVHRGNGTAGLVARVAVKHQGNTYVSHSTDTSWKISRAEFSRWKSVHLNDQGWSAAVSRGRLGQAEPWGREVATESGGHIGRFTVLREFRVESVLPAEKTGSLIAMTFNDFGQLLVSQEGGPLLLFSDEDQDGVPETPSTYCDQIKNCQGMLALNGQIFAVGQGPEGAGLYRISDDEFDGVADHVTLLCKFEGDMGEHGPHAPVLGPDGLIYVVVGNHSAPEKVYNEASPHDLFYEGDLLRPKHEDPGGHAVGRKVPGGVILRTDTQGSFVELFAGGLRNPYDIAFNRMGELFTFDADMEWDQGLPWYRPTRVNHIIPGAEFGWRSGSSKWPEYFFDSLPATVNVGPGSPAGITCYNHFMYPVRFQDSFFMCDWSRGRILNVRLNPVSGTYSAKVELFVVGRPLNCTDLEVGPDGWLYFCTGGRGTEGGVYRVVWTGKVPEEVKQLGTGVTAALRQPQPTAAWSQRRIVAIKHEMGEEWDRQIVGAVRSLGNKPVIRAHALSLMQLFGPFPSYQLLEELTQDPSTLVRAKATYLMGIHADPELVPSLLKMASDPNGTVRRLACEALARSGHPFPVEKIVPVLGDEHRYVAWAAMRAIQQIPAEQWAEAVLNHSRHRVFLVGCLALIQADSSEQTARAVLDRASTMMKGPMRDRDFVDMLRLIEVTLLHSGLTGEDLPELRQQLAQEYPSSHHQMNRQLVTLLTYLQEPSVRERMINQLYSDIPDEEKLHVALAGRHYTGWTSEQKLLLLKYLEASRELTGGFSLRGYVENASRDIVQSLSPEEREQVLTFGDEMPSAAFHVLASLPPDPGSEMLGLLQKLDTLLYHAEGEAVEKLRIAIIAVLARSRDPEAMAVLREIFRNDPERRAHVAMGLSQQPEGENWPLLVRSLPLLEGTSAQVVLGKLATVEQKPEDPEPIRQAILAAVRLGENGGQVAFPLLQQWTGEQPHSADDKFASALAKWQAWFRETYPAAGEPAIPSRSSANQWDMSELISFLESEDGRGGDPHRGREVYERAQCAKCHRFGGLGDGGGPDLTTVARRFHRKEIIESVLYPSHVISDQYASQTIVTENGTTYTGIVAPAGSSMVEVLLANGERVKVNKTKIDETYPAKISAMPEGLFDSLSAEEISDLFAFLSESGEAVATSESPSRRR